MLPGIGLQETLLIVIVAITVVGPKDLPLMLRKFGRWVAKMRAMAHDFQSSFEDLARQAELDDLRKEVEALRRDTARDFNTLKHAAHIDEPIESAVAASVEPEAPEAIQPDLPLEPSAASIHEPVQEPLAGPPLEARTPSAAETR